MRCRSQISAEIMKQSPDCFFQGGEQMINGKLRNMTSVFLTDGEDILMLYRQGSRVINNQWIGSAGGHFEPHELNDAGACIARELKEELGLDGSCLRDPALRYVSLRFVNGELWINYFFFAVLPGGKGMKLSSEEGILKWFSFPEVSSLCIPPTTKHVLAHYIREGRFTRCLYAAAADGREAVFTVLAPVTAAS